MQTECKSVQAIVQSEEIEIRPDLSQYDIHDVAEIYYNPSYELLFAHETAPSLSGHEPVSYTHLTLPTIYSV